MRIAPVAEVKAKFSAYLKESEEGPIVITRNGKPVAVLLAMDDEGELERLILAYSPKFQSILATARQQLREGKGIPHDQFWQEIEGLQIEP
jgi:prevent-host-death family protein